MFCFQCVILLCAVGHKLHHQWSVTFLKNKHLAFYTVLSKLYVFNSSFPKCIAMFSENVGVVYSLKANSSLLYTVYLSGTLFHLKLWRCFCQFLFLISTYRSSGNRSAGIRISTFFFILFLLYSLIFQGIQAIKLLYIPKRTGRETILKSDLQRRRLKSVREVPEVSH